MACDENPASQRPFRLGALSKSMWVNLDASQTVIVLAENALYYQHKRDKRLNSKENHEVLSIKPDVYIGQERSHPDQGPFSADSKCIAKQKKWPRRYGITNAKNSSEYQIAIVVSRPPAKMTASIAENRNPQGRSCRHHGRFCSGSIIQVLKVAFESSLHAPA